MMNNLKDIFKDKGATILTCAGVAGIVATTITTAKATPKAMKLMRQAEHEKGSELTKLEVLRTVGPTYIPSVLLGISTIACIVSVNMLPKRQQAAMVSAYGLLSETHQKYRNAAKSVYGEDADGRIHAEIAKTAHISGASLINNCSVYRADVDNVSEDVLFFDAYSHRYFTSTMPAVLQAQYHINRNFALRGGVSVNELYSFLGLSDIDCGDDIGWGQEIRDDGFDWIDFENQYVEMEDGMECYVISTTLDPMMASEDDDWGRGR